MLENTKELEVKYVGIALFILLESIPKQDPRAKRVRKKITRVIKKKLMTEVGLKKNGEEFNKMLDNMDNILIESRQLMLDKYGEKGNYINPGNIFELLNFRYDYLDSYNFDSKDIKELIINYRNASLSFQSLFYINRLIENIKKTIEQ